MRDWPAREPQPAMDRHHQQHDCLGSRLDDHLADRLALPGEARPAIWRAAPAQQPGCLSPRLAHLLLDDQTKVEDVVLDIDDDIAFAATAAATGRRHHALGGAHHLATMSHAAGYLDLILLHWPRPAVNPRWLLTACRSLLGVAGRLVIAVSVDNGQRMAHLTALGGAAATAGLNKIRHIAALDPDAATCEHPHADLLIFGVHDVKTADDG
ncbi:hypothetical protein [Virgisporangium aurantiacum]|uniref:Uncharacterized protein n=1 Tax=Virgisporangium aurantiacum TaxID=175570 RepID=A0A8J4E1Q3_9ACTN|nr:hypothetical protein [Virgisporangium aurantiacum]GIJ56217.1 hypothetical protein Vau01_037330 [Virgisporangium aurantiacum]